jgi:hypothetical protein
MPFEMFWIFAVLVAALGTLVYSLIAPEKAPQRSTRK